MEKKEKTKKVKCPHCSKGEKPNQPQGLSGRWNIIECPARIPVNN